MNELSNKVLSELAGLGNFFKNKDLNGAKDKQDHLDKKLFFLFEQSNSQEKGKKRKRNKKASSSDYSRHTSSSN